LNLIGTFKIDVSMNLIIVSIIYYFLKVFQLFIQD